MTSLLDLQNKVLDLEAYYQKGQLAGFHTFGKNLSALDYECRI